MLEEPHSWTVGFGPNNVETLEVPGPVLASGAAIATAGALLVLAAAVLPSRRLSPSDNMPRPPREEREAC